MNPITAIKRRLHRDIVADPALHARVLNLYRCGEAYPHSVDDYFPVQHVTCPDLAGQMRGHQQDEDKHIALYSRAIEKLGEPVLDLPERDIFNHVIRAHTGAVWRVDATQDADTRTDRIANFMAHAHWLEKRVARSLEFHFDACAHAASDFPGKAVAVVLADETRHVAYTRHAVFDLLPKQRAQAVLDHHRQAEWRANLDFSSQQLQRLLADGEVSWPRSRQPMYRACALAMRGVLACV